MIQKTLILLSILGIITGGMMAFANVAYFPMDRGVQLEVRMNSVEASLNTKLDKVIVLLEKDKGI